MNKELLAIFFISLALAGCGTVRRVDSQVSAFVTQPVAAGARYRFERLPSQQAQPAEQQKLEAMAERALAQAGLQRDDAGASLAAQLTVSQRAELLTDRGVGVRWHLGWRVGAGHIGLGHGPLWPGLADRTNHIYELRLTLRDLRSQTVVFETSAQHDGPWSDSEAIVPAMLQAALQGFPAPPQGPRQVPVDIPR